jgi:hypothetical protein
MTIRRNAALCDLARAVYRARGEVYGGSLELSDEPPSVRQDYITRADELLRTLAPSTADDVLQYAARRAQFSLIHPEGD